MGLPKNYGETRLSLYGTLEQVFLGFPKEAISQ